MPSLPRRDIFACGKSAIVRFAHSDSIFAAYTREANITAEDNITRRKANITEKRTYESKCVFLARLAGLEPTALRIGI